MNLQVRNRIRKALTYSFTGFIFLLISGFLILQIPAVQESLIQRYLRGFSKVIGFNTTVESFQLLWFDRLELRNLNVYDPQKNRMIGAETVIINFQLSQLFKQDDINVDAVAVDGANVFLTMIPETDTSTNLNINVFVDRINENYGGSGGTGRTPRINIGEAVINKSKFSYIDQEEEPIEEGFNYRQFTINIDEGQLQNFMILGDTTEFKVNTLLATDEKTNFNVTQLSTFFRLSQQSMEFFNLQVTAGNSTISDTIIFRYNSLAELSDEFISKVNIHAELRNTVIQPADLALFAPDAKRLTQTINLNGVFNGRVDNFKLTNMEVGTGHTTLRGSLDMEGLPDLTETFIILELKDSKFDFDDFSFLFNDQALERLRPLGRLNLAGQFLGYPTDFVANGQFSGKLGRIKSDINFKVNEKNFDLSEYSGQLALSDFDLGSYMRDTVNFQRVDLSGNVKGSGLTFKTADFKLKGKVNSIGIRQYDYKNITTNARFASQLFNGFLKIDDPNLQFTAQGSVDLREGFNTIRMQAQLDTAFLHNLHLTPNPTFVHTNIDIDVKGLHIDSVAGHTDLKDFKVSYKDKWLELDEIHLTAERSKQTRKIQLRSNLVNAEVSGDFLLSDISTDMETLVEEILLNIRNDKEAISNYYTAKTSRPKTYQAKFKVDLNDVDPITKLLDLDVDVSEKTTLHGKFTSGYTSILQAYANVDSLRIKGSLFLNTDLDLTASKIADSTSILAMASVNSERQIFSSNFITQNLISEAIWNNNHIEFGIDGDQEGESNYIRLKGAVDFLKDTTQLKILPTTVKVLQKVWDFDPQNLISISKREVSVSNLTMRNNNQYVSANGFISDDPDKKLSLRANDLDLSLLNPLTGRDIKGTLDAQFDLTNYYDNPYVQNDVRIDSLTVDQFLVGDITGKNLWDNAQKKFLIQFFVDRNEKRIVNVNGDYDPAKEANPLDVTARLEDANLKIIEPFLEDLFRDISGTVTGDYRVTGTLTEPALQGEGQIPNGQLTVDYLKTPYRFTGIIGLSPHSIYFKNFELTDMFNNHANLSGAILHDNFFNMRVNFNATFRNFQLLNTAAKDNSLFYGQGYGTGDMNLVGPISNLKITANARTDRNTRIYIPIGGSSEVEKKEFIKFVNFTDSTFQKSLSEQINNKVDLTGITMDFNLDVTPDAYCEIILDLKAGDIIRGRGNGELQLQFDTQGDFNMFGPFEFSEGWYNFTLYDIVNKDFEIKKGSRINWYGDAYGGILNISASYKQLASFAPIISDQTISNAPQLRRKYPTQVLLKLDGPMLSPQINFDIVANDLPQTITVENKPPVRLAFEFQAFKNRIDEQELKRQVFSLIILRRFSPPESFNTSGSIANSVSEFLSNQLSNWISQVDENLQIDVDLSTFDQEAFNTFQLRLSYTFLNGRLRITRDATTFYGNSNANSGVGTPAGQQNSVASIAGDWTVDYLLTADGKLKVKMYNRSNINPILNTVGAQNAVTTGVSILHTQNFNQLRDIWRASRRRKEEKPAEETDANEEAAQKTNDGGGL
jgi:hypothetical protein